MRTKYLLAAGLSVSLLFLGLPFSSVSAASAGQKCSKVGLRSGTKTTPLICVKVGKEFVWKSSEKIVKTTTTTINPKAKAPTAPTQLKLKMNRPFDGSGKFTWKDNSNNEKNFYVSKIDPVNLAGVPLKTLLKVPKDGTMVGLGSYLNENFCFWVMASNASGNSPWSGPACYLGGATTTTTTAYVPPTTAYAPPTTAYVAPSTTVATRPSGTWYPMWMTLGAPKDLSGNALGGPGLNVVYGQQTELVFCLSSGENPSTLEVKENGVWRKVASGFRQSSDAGRCSNSAEPISFSFYWVVDSNGTKSYRRNGTEYRTRELEIRITTSVGAQPMLRSVGSNALAYAYDFADTLKCAFGETSYC
jgi:hypothetical protein